MNTTGKARERIGDRVDRICGQRRNITRKEHRCTMSLQPAFGPVPMDIVFATRVKADCKLMAQRCSFRVMLRRCP